MTIVWRPGKDREPAVPHRSRRTTALGTCSGHAKRSLSLPSYVRFPVILFWILTVTKLAYLWMLFLSLSLQIL